MWKKGEWILEPDCEHLGCTINVVCVCVSRSVLSDSLQPHGARQTPLSIGFPRQEYLSGLPFPLPGDLPYPGIEPMLLEAPELHADSLPSEPPGKPIDL